MFGSSPTQRAEYSSISVKLIKYEQLRKLILYWVFDSKKRGCLSLNKYINLQNQKCVLIWDSSIFCVPILKHCKGVWFWGNYEDYSSEKLSLSDATQVQGSDWFIGWRILSTVQQALPGELSLKSFIHWIIAEEYFSLQTHAELLFAHGLEIAFGNVF